MTKVSIGTNAGAIWRALSNHEKWDASSLKQATGLSDTELFASIGWLARENKIELETINGSDYYYLGYEECYY